MKPDPRHRHEKPYRLNYIPAPDTIPATNTTNELQPIRVADFRPAPQTRQTYADYGFVAATLPSALAPADFDDPAKVRDVYYPETVRLVKGLYLDAFAVHVLERQIRKRPAAFPVATGQPYENLLPTTLVHIDYTTDSAIRSSRAAFREASDRASRLVTVNVWKCLQGPGNDWPVALCDRRTVNHVSETIGQDVVSADGFNSNSRLYYNPEHQWYYYKDLREDEVIVFLQIDTDVEGGGGVPHTGFPNPEADEGAAPRESIEVRLFVFFE